jgi:proline iminopeptidase
MSPRNGLAVLIAALAFAATARPDGPPARPTTAGSVRRDGFDLHYRVVGNEGPYVVILAGGPGLDVDYMASVTDELAKSHRCVLLDQRGTGKSRLTVVDAATVNWAGYLGDLEALRAHLKEDKLTLLGHSWGMAYGLAYAAEYPDRCRGVVSVGSCPISAEYMRVFDDNRTSRLHPSEREVLAYWADPERAMRDPDRALCEVLRAITPTDFYDRRKGVEHAMRWRPEWCHAGVSAAGLAACLSDYDLRRRLKTVTCPVLIVHGYQDVVGEANVLEAKGLLRHGTLKFVHRCGHYPWLDQPAETWQAVRPFLDSLPR